MYSSVGGKGKINENVKYKIKMPCLAITIFSSLTSDVAL